MRTINTAKQQKDNKTIVIKEQLIQDILAKAQRTHRYHKR